MVKTILTITAILFAGAGTLAFVGCHGHSPEGKADWVVEKMTRELELDEDQTAQLHQIKENILEKAREARANRGIIRETVTAELEKETIDQERLNQMVDERLAHIKEMATFVIAELAEFHAELTPTQREKLVAEIKTWPERHRRWHRRQ